MAIELFSKEFLSEHLSKFRLSSVTDINHKRSILSNWFDEWKSGKLVKLKEEEIKSRFILEIFGEVLGFNYKNSTKWLVREEVKSVPDGTKADAALGIFYINETGIDNDVRVVIEVKNAATLLDKPQNRKAFKLTPIDQAFLYASKSGGHCKWVVVSNFVETRFYHYTSQNAHQSYKLSDLQDEEKLKELLFLFHKDRFTNSAKSTTDKLYELRRNIIASNKDRHIIDQLYDAVHKFEGLNFIDPDFLCNIKPFNVLNDHVWHFEGGRLLTLNTEITGLLKEIQVSNNELVFSDQLLKQLRKAKLPDAKERLTYVFQKLHQCLISEVCAIIDLESIKEKDAGAMGFSMRHFHHIDNSELIILPTKLGDEAKCDCINCNYRSFDFKKFIRKVKTAETNNTLDVFEEAYANYLLATDNFKKAYFTYKRAEINTKGYEGKNIQYFIAKINQIHLYNLVEGYDNDQDKDILLDIKAIDLDRSIHNELDIYVDDDVRKYLIDIKEDKLFIKINKRVNQITEKIETGRAWSRELNELNRQYLVLYAHFHKNYLVFDAFTDFKNLVTKIIKTVFIAYKNPEYQMLSFPEFYLVEAILYVQPSQLQEILKDSSDIELNDIEKADLVGKAENLLKSYYHKGFFSSVKEEILSAQLLNYRFLDKYTNLFSNVFTVLTYLDLKSDQIQALGQPIMCFMRTEDILAHFDIKQLGKFIERYGDIFKKHELLELLQISIDYDTYGTHKYENLINSVAIAHREYYPDILIEDKSLIKRAIANNTNSSGRTFPRHLVPLYSIIDDFNKTLLLNEWEKCLDQEFDDFLLIELMSNNIIKLTDKDYLLKYVTSVNKSKGKGYTGSKNGNPEFQDVYMINLIYQIYAYGIEFKTDELKMLQTLSPFEEWAINPIEFDYSKFDPEWLLAVDQDYIFKRLGDIDSIKNSLEEYLRNTYNNKLSEVYFKYFN